MDDKANKSVHKIPIEIEFTEGYEQRFTAAMLKIYENRRRKEIANLEAKEQAAS